MEEKKKKCRPKTTRISVQHMKDACAAIAKNPIISNDELPEHLVNNNVVGYIARTIMGIYKRGSRVIVAWDVFRPYHERFGPNTLPGDYPHPVLQLREELENRPNTTIVTTAAEARVPALSRLLSTYRPLWYDNGKRMEKPPEWVRCPHDETPDALTPKPKPKPKAKAKTEPPAPQIKTTRAPLRLDPQPKPMPEIARELAVALTSFNINTISMTVGDQILHIELRSAQ